MRLLGIAVLSTICGAATAQTPPSFEVASVRLTEGGGRGGGRGMMMMPALANIRVGPGGALTMRGVTLRGATRWAYSVADFQVTGPDWIDQQRYDITAKAAAEPSVDQLRLMLQALLTERFKMAVRRAPKESQVWVITVAKGGPKFKAAPAEGDPTIEGDPQKMRVGLHKTSVADVGELLSGFLRAPVLDETGLTGKFDINVDMAKYFAEQQAGQMDMLSTIVTAIQQELGLKLETRKVPVDFVMIERAERTPVEN
jgi:uncharacterized protein (TIGR03435 family)